MQTGSLAVVLEAVLLQLSMSKETHGEESGASHQFAPVAAVPLTRHSPIS